MSWLKKMLFDEEIPDEIRTCTWCAQAFLPTRENFNTCKHGRFGLMTVCRTCQKHDAKLRARYRQIYDDPQVCDCGYEGKLEVDHEHRHAYAFVSYKCRSCNIKAREPYFRGPTRSKRANGASEKIIA